MNGLCYSAAGAIACCKERSTSSILCQAQTTIPFYISNVLLSPTRKTGIYLGAAISHSSENKLSPQQATNTTTDYGRPVRKSPSLHGRKSNPNSKFLGTAEAYFVSHISPNFQFSLIYVFIGCPLSVNTTIQPPLYM